MTTEEAVRCGFKRIYHCAGCASVCWNYSPAPMPACPKCGAEFVPFDRIADALAAPDPILVLHGVALGGP